MLITHQEISGEREGRHHFWKVTEIFETVADEVAALRSVPNRFKLVWFCPALIQSMGTQKRTESRLPSMLEVCVIGDRDESLIRCR